MRAQIESRPIIRRQGNRHRGRLLLKLFGAGRAFPQVTVAGRSSRKKIFRFFSFPVEQWKSGSRLKDMAAAPKHEDIALWLLSVLCFVVVMAGLMVFLVIQWRHVKSLPGSMDPDDAADGLFCLPSSHPPQFAPKKRATTACHQKRQRAGGAVRAFIAQPQAMFLGRGFVRRPANKACLSRRPWRADTRHRPCPARSRRGCGRLLPFSGGLEPQARPDPVLSCQQRPQPSRLGARRFQRVTSAPMPGPAKTLNQVARQLRPNTPCR